MEQPNRLPITTYIVLSYEIIVLVTLSFDLRGNRRHGLLVTNYEVTPVQQNLSPKVTRYRLLKTV